MIVLIKENRVVLTEENSRGLAKKMKDTLEEFKDSKEETISRNVRKKNNKGIKYKGYYIQEL